MSIEGAGRKPTLCSDHSSSLADPSKSFSKILATADDCGMKRRVSDVLWLVAKSNQKRTRNIVVLRNEEKVRILIRVKKL